MLYQHQISQRHIQFPNSFLIIDSQKAHRAFLAAITAHGKPNNFLQVVADPNWRDTISKEISALEENETWVLTSLLPGKKVIDSKWVYKIKYKPCGQVGYLLPFHETFASVSKLVTVQCVLAVASKRKWIIHQMDVNNAFLQGDLDKEVYKKIPQGFVKTYEDCVCKLQKSIYGLRQASEIGIKSLPSL